MKFLLLFLLPILIISSCSSTIFIEKDDASLRELNEKLEREKVTLRLLNSNEITGINIQVKSDSTSIREIKVLTKDVKEISMISHGTGTLKGIGYGAFGAFTVGALIGVLSYNPDESHGFVGPRSSAAAALWGGTLFGVAGFLVGGIIGGIHGDIEKFIFPLTNSKYSSFVSLEISEFIEKSSNYIIIVWKDKVIRLLRSEYKYGEKTKDGKQIIVVPREVYLEKF